MDEVIPDKQEPKINNNREAKSMEFTAEQKAAIAIMVEEATSGLVAKNADLLKDLKKIQKVGAPTQEQLDSLENQIDALKIENTTISKTLKAATKTAEDANKLLLAESGFTTRLLIDNGLVAALAANGVVDPALMKGAQAMLRSGVQVISEGDNRIAKYGDKALAEHIKEWAGSDEGKRYVTAKQNIGGGATGGTGSAEASKTMTRAAFNAITPKEQSNFSRSGGKLTE